MKAAAARTNKRLAYNCRVIVNYRYREGNFVNEAYITLPLDQMFRY